MNEKAEWKEQKEKKRISIPTTKPIKQWRSPRVGQGEQGCIVQGWLVEPHSAHSATVQRQYRVNRVIVCNFDLKVQQPAIYHSTQRHKSMSMLNQKIKGRKQKERENGRERMREDEGGRVRAVS